MRSPEWWSRSTAAAGAPLTGVPITDESSRPEALVESYRRLAEVFHDVLSEQSLDALLDRVAATLADLVPYEALHIYEVDEDRRVLVPVFASSQAYDDEIMHSRPRFGEGITGWAVENRAPSGRTAHTSIRGSSTSRGRRSSPRR